MKPLITPERRHRDRRGGRASAAFRRALDGSTDREPVVVRSAEERLAAYRRLAARRHVEAVSDVTLVVIATVAVLLLIVLATVTVVA